ncbi:MAG: glycine cleavage system aminomethyltransferase GcvT [Kineosporiaceae bacterium]
MTDLPQPSAPDAPVALRRTALWPRHRELGAKTADFGGWEMPVEYPGGGVLKEHEAVRAAVGLFDVSHLGKLRVHGPGAAAFVDSCLTNALGRIGPGQAQYTLCCAEDGGVVDDLIAYLVGPDEVLLVPNAANSGDVAAMLRAQAPAGVEVVDLHDDLAVLAVQGPRSDEVMTAVGLPCGGSYMAFTTTDRWGEGSVVCRTGYTGERGYELLVPRQAALQAWDDLLAAVRAQGGLPGGLGARDTLRTEMGYPLHGHELSRAITPLEARLAWAVGWSKPRFWGREALLAAREAGAARVLVGLRALGRGVPRADLEVRDGEGRVVGTTTSGTFSPTLRTGIALALVDSAALGADGSAPAGGLQIDVRGRGLDVEVVRPPFVESRPGR